MSAADEVTVGLWTAELEGAVVSGFVETYNGEPWNDAWTPATAAQYLAEFRGMPRATALVAVIAGRVVGAAYVHARTWQDGSEIYIDEFFVFPHAQRRGVGRALLSSIRERADAMGAEDLTLLTDRDVPAFDFYRSLGFREGSRQVFMIG